MSTLAQYILSVVRILVCTTDNLRMSKEEKLEKQIKSLGQHLREIRLSKGWTLEETENQGWPNWRHLQKIESGKNITIATLFKLSKLYSIKPSELLKKINL